MTLIRVAWTDGADQSLGLPSYATPGAAGADLRANFPPNLRPRGVLIWGQSQEAIPTGLRMEIPEGYEVQLRPRSGLARKHMLTILNAPGTVDSDYRGEVMVLLFNAKGTWTRIRHGDRIAQMVVAPVQQARFEIADHLSDTDRGAGGFGSTGTR
ncbi:MAG: dUTP diphosphatase [Pseudomonadota bacterium]